MQASNSFWRVISPVLAFLIILALFLFHIFRVESPLSLPHTFSSERDVFYAPRRNVWADMETEEVVDLLKFLHADQSLNLTLAENATDWDNHVSVVEVLRPNKTDVLSYLSSTAEEASLPKRWARVTVDHGADLHPAVYEYMVGPLPTDNYTKIIPLEYCYNSGRSYTPKLLADINGVLSWSAQFTTGISDIMADLFGQDFFDGNKTIPFVSGAFGGSIHYENGRTVGWAAYHKTGGYSEAFSLLPQALYIKIDLTTRDPANWKILLWLYNGVYYHSLEDFRSSWQSSSFQRIPPNMDGDWTTIESFEGGISEREQPPPVMIQPYAPRYSLDKKENYVSWMGFEFYFASSQVQGMSLYDIRFKGERIIYELGLQEALAHYAGDDPLQGLKAFLDTFFGMGSLMFELVPGYDCPAYASYIDTKWHRGESSTTNKNSICLFEYTADHPLQRHTASKYVTISRNTYLVLRSVSTVGNYDYTIDYIFYLDGTVEVKVRASGYISGAYWSFSPRHKEKNEYGYRVHDQFLTSVHDHVLNFKADLDIAGTSNTLVRVGIEPTSTAYNWESDPRTPRNTMRLTHQSVREETGLNWPSNAAEMFIVMNNESRNIWGEKRGYHIRPGTGMGTPSHFTLQNSTIIGNAANWAMKDLWVVKEKATEPRSASPANALYINEPLIDFSKFVDGESVDQEDLVIYFNLGVHHVPHSGDIPNTLMHTSASSVIFSPHNFHDRDPARLSSQGVKLELAQDGNHTVRYYGSSYKHGVTLNLTALEPNLTNYHATQLPVRKFPWNDSMIAV